MTLYGLAAQAMKAQAARDVQVIRVGGPVLSGYSQLWVDTLLTTPTTAPYVDFISYHQYFFGSTNLQAKWDQYTGDWSLYNAMQDPNNGAFAIYNKVLGRAALGQQPGGVNVPIYVTEFNTNWAFFQDCCRNDPTYAPVFNSLYAVDMLNSVYNGSAHTPNQPDVLCLVGLPVVLPNRRAGCELRLQLLSGGESDSVSAVLRVPVTGLAGIPGTAGRRPYGQQHLHANRRRRTGDDGVLYAHAGRLGHHQPDPEVLPGHQRYFRQPGLRGNAGHALHYSKRRTNQATGISFATAGTSRSTTIAVPPYSVQAISLK